MTLLDSGVGGIRLGAAHPFQVEKEKMEKLDDILKNESELDVSKIFILNAKDSYLQEDLAYHDAYKREYWTLKGPRIEHIRHITIRGDRNNNKMERLNGEIRDREKVMSGLKTTDTPYSLWLPNIPQLH